MAHRVHDCPRFTRECLPRFGPRHAFDRWDFDDHRRHALLESQRVESHTLGLHCGRPGDRIRKPFA